ncbi:hypothetical protein [Solitalea lacus]|uniref:hypothetical protein n=1 Tax=Solitalea lacus TaxID=2911172 RepID=UPI001EDA5FC8|nr:hypothetical protein [Solitalea lacus]UKJ06508.1 hypothetical protein L2B55_13315 [Solitalea lacus]
MTKPLYIFFLLVLSVTAYSQERFVIISGQFENTKAGAYLIVHREGYFGKKAFTDSICLHDDGSFEDTLRVTEPSLTLFSLSNESDWLNNNIKGFLFPDYSLYMTGDVKQGLKNTLKYYNCGEIVNNFLLEREKRFVFDVRDFTIIKPLEHRQRTFTALNNNIGLYNKSYTQAVLLSETAFTDSLANYYKARKKFQEEYFMHNRGKDGDYSVRFFEALEIVDIQFSELLALLKYPSQNVLIAHELGIPWSDVNVHFYKRFEPMAMNQFEAYLPVVNYRDFLVRYINLLVGDYVEVLNVNPQLSTFTERFELAKEQYNGKIRELVLAEIIKENCIELSQSHEGSEETEQLIEEFKKLNPDEFALKEIEGIYSKAKMQAN